jgi:uncharacterized protein YbjT (DUF2867 family)
MAFVVLTGASGVLGRHVHRFLREDGHQVVSLSRNPPRKDGWARADLATGQGVAEASRGAEALVHCATHPFQTAQVDLEGLRHLRRAAPDARIVYPSIVGVDRIAFPYYRAKVAVEREVQTAEHAIVRLTQFHEFPHQLAALPFPVVPWGFRTQPIAAREAARAVADAVEGPGGRRPDVGGPEVHSLRALVRRVREAQGRRAIVPAVPMPGSLGFRQGLNLCPDRRVGRQTWDEHFEAWNAAGRQPLGRT